MHHVHEFTYGALTPALSYVMSFVGCFLGLLCTARASRLSGAPRYRWLALGSLSIGGTGIWAMHFIAMLGFTVGGMTIRYDVTETLLSALVAIVFVAAGLLVYGFDSRNPLRLIGSGLLTGLGVAAMHYLGTEAIRMPGKMSYDPLLVELSVLIAVVAATVALWFVRIVSNRYVTVGAALIMAVAVSGMHYTGMAAMHVSVPVVTFAPLSAPTVSGATAAAFITPLICGVGGLTFLMLAIIALSPSHDELADEAAVQQRFADGQQHDGDRQPAARPASDAPRSWFDG